MSTRRERELLLSRDQAAYVAQSLTSSIYRVVAKFRATRPVVYEGADHDRDIARQVLDGVIYELRQSLQDTLDRITRKHIP